jgi:hypothetical protein
MYGAEQETGRKKLVTELPSGQETMKVNYSKNKSEDTY